MQHSDPRNRADKAISRLDDALASGEISREDYNEEVREIERDCAEWEREEDRRTAWDVEHGR